MIRVRQQYPVDCETSVYTSLNYPPICDTHALYLLYLSTSLLWWQAVAGIIGVTSSHALRSNSRYTWRPKRARKTSTTPPSAARSARCARGVAPIRHPFAIRDNPVANTGGETAQSPDNSMGCDARPPLLFLPPGHGLTTTRCSSEPIDITAY